MKPLCSNDATKLGSSLIFKINIYRNATKNKYMPFYYICLLPDMPFTTYAFSHICLFPHMPFPMASKICPYADWNSNFKQANNKNLQFLSNQADILENFNYL